MVPVHPRLPGPGGGTEGAGRRPLWAGAGEKEGGGVSGCAAAHAQPPRTHPLLRGGTRCGQDQRRAVGGQDTQ